MAPAPVVGGLNDAIDQTLAGRGLRRSLGGLGFGLLGGTPEFHAGSLAAETATWREVMAAAHVPPPT